MWRRILPILIISSLLTIGVFGFLGLSSVDHGTQHTCPISLISDGDCSSIKGSLALAFHHISGIQNFTQSVISFDASVLILAFLLILASFVVSKLPQETRAPRILFRQISRGTAESTFIPERRFLRWLALHHKRDPHALQWVHDACPVRNSLSSGVT